VSDSLICAPVLDPARDRRAVGSIVESCAKCERQVWVAPTGQAMIAEKGLRVLCIPCGFIAYRADPERKIAPVSEEQKAEIRRALSDDA
jgi:hypothetical protein